mgnify:CR=1 FL=1
MAEYVTVYFADTDEPASEAPSLDNAVRFTLRLDLNQVGEWVELYAKSDEGYEILEAVVTPTGATAERWQLALDTESPEAYGAALALGTIEDGVPTTFYVRARAVDTEVPANDATVTLVLSGDAAVPEV